MDRKKPHVWHEDRHTTQLNGQSMYIMYTEGWVAHFIHIIKFTNYCELIYISMSFTRNAKISGSQTFYRHNVATLRRNLTEIDTMLRPTRTAFVHWCPQGPCLSASTSSGIFSIRHGHVTGMPIPLRTTTRPTRSYPVHYINRSNLKTVGMSNPGATPPQTTALPTQHCTVALLNVRSLTNKSFFINDLILSKKLHFTFLVETWLHIFLLKPVLQTIHFYQYVRQERRGRGRGHLCRLF